VAPQRRASAENSAHIVRRRRFLQEGTDAASKQPEALCTQHVQLCEQLPPEEGHQAVGAEVIHAIDAAEQAEQEAQTMENRACISTASIPFGYIKNCGLS